MKYDFESILDRRGMDAIAVDPGTDPYGIAPKGKIREGFDIIPMWVADMNFPTCPAIPQAVIARAQHPAYGYFDIRKEYYDEIIKCETPCFRIFCSQEGILRFHHQLADQTKRR